MMGVLCLQLCGVEWRKQRPVCPQDISSAQNPQTHPLPAGSAEAVCRDGADVRQCRLLLWPANAIHVHIQVISRTTHDHRSHGTSALMSTPMLLSLISVCLA